MIKLGVLVSGTGTNLGAILDAIRRGALDAQVALVISNKPGVAALDRARSAGVPARVVPHRDFASREAFDTELVSALRAASVDWVVLAGFMRLLTPVFLDAFPWHVVNVHPALLPAFPGVDAQRQAFEYGVKVTGCTVHLVDPGTDTGPIIAQRSVEVQQGDDVESLRLRILDAEHLVLTEVLQAIANDRLEVIDRADRRTRILLRDR